MKHLALTLAALAVSTIAWAQYDHGQNLIVRSGQGGKYGYADATGHFVIKPRYDFAEKFQDGIARVRINGKFGLIDPQGNELAATQYSNIYPFRENAAVAVKEGKYGYLNRNGEEIVPFVYDRCHNFEEGVGVVCRRGKYGLVNLTGREVVACIFGSAAEAKSRYLKSFSNFARNYVEERIRVWQQKGEFEKTSDWQARVTQQTRNARIEALTREAEQIYIDRNLPYLSLSIEGNYDADNEVFMLDAGDYGRLLVPVPIDEAPTFKKKWDKARFYPRYFIDNDFPALAELMIAFPSGKIYKYSNRASLNYTVAQVDYNFDPIEIAVDSGTPDGGSGSQNISTVNISVGKSDVDIDIPVGRGDNASTFAVIIANENYQKESPVEFARNDGDTFRKYCISTLGLPEKNIRYVPDATLNNMRTEIDWVCRVARTYKGSADIIVYYAGHGIPDEASRSSYLLPVDGIGYNAATGYKLSELYDQLGSVPAGSVTVFLDACFSGAKRDGEMLASARGVAIKAKTDAPSGNMVVFTAAQGDETAYPYREKGHGLFTYYLLKKLQQTRGDATFGELGDYIAEEVGRTAIVENSKSQTPQAIASPAMADKWRSMKLK